MKTYFFQDTVDPRTGAMIDCHCTSAPGTQHDGPPDPDAARAAWIRLRSRSVRDAASVTPDPDAARAAWLRRQTLHGLSDAQLRQTLTDTLRGTQSVTLNDARDNPPDPDAARAAWLQRMTGAH
jgi:hypothetical protein